MISQLAIPGLPGFRQAGQNPYVKSRSARSWNSQDWEKKGQVTIPRPVLKRLGPGAEIPLTVETTANGAIVRSK